MSEIDKQQTYSDFWLNTPALDQYMTDESVGEGFSTDLIQFATYRRVVSNFVIILTGLDIPVQFNSDENSKLSFTDGKAIYISATIKNKKDFDWTVGLALHEASHILLTDFEVFHSTFSKIPIPVPMTLKKKSKDKNVSGEQLAYICKWVWNFIEDRYIDNYVFSEAPGYRGYYESLYQKFWNNEIQSKALRSFIMRVPNILSYEFRIINLTNEATDLDALPGLREIAELIDIDNIYRLNTTLKRMNLSYAVVELIMDNIIKQAEQKSASDSTIQKIHEKLSEKNGTSQSSHVDDFKDYEPDDVGDTNEFSSDELKELSDEFNKQRNVLDHKYGEIKTRVTKEEQTILDAIENSDISLVPSGYGLSGDYERASVDVVVVKKLSKKLMDAGKHIFPLVSLDKFISRTTNAPIREYEDAVVRGFSLGKMLGKKLQIRGEENHIKYIRKSSGKIERRLLADVGAGLEGIFNRTIIEKYNKLRLHISVDASGSMQTYTKWCPTMTCVVAICVAASMVENLDVSVSFRSTIFSKCNNSELPYIVLAYDSKVDKISKIRHLFPYLCATGSTPEGLTFESIAEEFIIGKKSNEQDHYFLNISDGEPCYVINSLSNRYHTDLNYSGETGALHTKMQVEKIKRRGVKVLSYFIDSNDGYSGLSSYKNTQLTYRGMFDKMYGSDAQFIDVQNVMDIARTMNKLFLMKE